MEVELSSLSSLLEPADTKINQVILSEFNTQNKSFSHNRLDGGHFSSLSLSKTHSAGVGDQIMPGILIIYKLKPVGLTSLPSSNF